jgi:sulfur relay (sulfurtransferase) complex TusBCD TusD component (DsrE family)
MAPTTRSQSRRARPDTLIKLLRKGRTHFDHTYTEGLNVCTQPWDNGHCTSGGLYACELRHLFRWITLYPDITEVAWVDVPADALVARFNTKIKASKLVLRGFMPVEDAARLAIQVGPDVHADDDQALRLASMLYGHTEVVRLLLQAGANVHASDDDALRSASYNGHTEAVRLLLNAGADVHACNDQALRSASAFGRTEVVRLLLQAGADVHASDDDALRSASYNGYTEVVRLLRQAERSDVAL